MLIVLIEKMGFTVRKTGVAVAIRDFAPLLLAGIAARKLAMQFISYLFLTLFSGTMAASAQMDLNVFTVVAAQL